MLRNRPNQPLERRALRESMMLLPPRLCGRPSWSAASPWWYVVWRRPRLKRRRMLPGRLDVVGEAGPSSARRLVPDSWDCGEVVGALPLLVALVPAGCVLPVAGVSGGVGPASSSSIGDGRGGGMLVPSVSEPNCRSRDGSSKRMLLAVSAGAAVVVFGCNAIAAL